MTMEMTPAETKAMEAMANDEPVDETTIDPPVEEAKPEAAPESKPEEKPAEKPAERTYPEAAYKREQYERKQALARARELEQREATLKGRLEVLEQLVKGTPQEPQAPSPDQDLGGHLLHKTTTIEKRIEELAKREQEDARRREQETQESQFLNTYRTSVQQFSQKAPDFAAAYNHVHQIRDKELEAMGIEDPAERENIRQQEERFLVARAQAAGLNPAEQLYKMAQVRGYAKKEQPRGEDGKFTATEKLDQIAKGQTQAKTLATAEGAGPGGKSSLEALLEMSESEFIEATKGDKWKRLFT